MVDDDAFHYGEQRIISEAESIFGALTPQSVVRLMVTFLDKIAERNWIEGRDAKTRIDSTTLPEQSEDSP